MQSLPFVILKSFTDAQDSCVVSISRLIMSHNKCDCSVKVKYHLQYFHYQYFHHKWCKNILQMSYKSHKIINLSMLFLSCPSYIKFI